MIAARYRRIECTAAIEIGSAADIDLRARGRRARHDRALRWRHYDVLSALRSVIDPVCVVIGIAGDRDCRGGDWQSRNRRPDRKPSAKAETRVIATPVVIVIVPGVYSVALQVIGFVEVVALQIVGFIDTGRL